MSKTASEKTWNELTPEEVERFYRLGSERSKQLGERAYSAWMEFAKYLFAANTGAAAGLFLLLRSSAAGGWYTAAFFLFCAGTFFVGLSYFCFSSWTHHVAIGWAEDFESLARNEIALAELDARHRNRQGSRTFKAMRVGLAISFLLLIAGAITAAKPFWSP